MSDVTQLRRDSGTAAGGQVGYHSTSESSLDTYLWTAESCSSLKNNYSHSVKNKKRRRFQWVTMMFGQATCEVDAN